ncbi:MAG: anthranilate phosphoribosyltransferase [bacterium]|nr:anthranilate phosphoribosyltransferase [bacterium]
MFEFAKIMSGQATEEEIKEFLIMTNKEGITAPNITAFATIMRDKSEQLEVRDVVDTCGTGGDSSHTFNISTAAAIVAASCGVRIAKHGNRAASSKSGSADLLELLGYNLNKSKEEVRADIINKNFGFMFAPLYHPAMKYVAKARKDLGIRTVFNILGPLANPAQAKYQLLGVYDASLTEIMAQVLGNLGAKHAFVVAACDGLDEISLMSETKVTEYRDGEVKTFMFDPRDYGFRFCNLQSLQVTGIEESKAAVLTVLQGEKGPKRDIVVLNSAFILLVIGKVKTIKSGIVMAEDVLSSGKAYAKLQELIV